MRSGLRNSLSILIVGGIFAAVMIAGMIGNIRSGNFIVIPIVFTAISIVGLAIWLARHRVRQLLRSPTPDRIIAHYRTSVRRIPHADAAAAYLAALVAAFFGEFERARRELGTVDWEKTSAMYRGHRLYVLAMLALLEDSDYPKALSLSDEGKKLESTDPSGGLQLLDDAIRLVASGPAAGAIERLEKVARKQQGLMPGICAWSLAIQYKRTGDPQKAAEFKELLRFSVPYSAPLKS